MTLGIPVAAEYPRTAVFHARPSRSENNHRLGLPKSGLNRMATGLTPIEGRCVCLQSEISQCESKLSHHKSPVNIKNKETLS